MITNVPLSELENKDEKVYYIKFRHSKYFKCLIIILLFIFICTLIGYFYTNRHDVGWLYINFIIGLCILILLCPHLMQMYVTCNEKKIIKESNYFEFS